jgi:hypothetical protein
MSQRVLTKYAEDQPRDAHGRWTNNGVSSAKDNYSKLGRGMEVTINPSELKPLLQHAARGENGDRDTDLTNLHINGVPLFDKPNMGIPRKNMPQVPTNSKTDFLQELDRRGISVERTEVNPLDLNPVQNEIQAEKSGGIMNREEAKNADPRLVPDTGRIIVSSDDYVMDGHHRWAAYSAMALENPDVKIPVVKVDMPATDLLPVMEAYAQMKNIPKIGMGESNQYKAAALVAQRRFDALVYNVVRKNLVRNG